MKTQANKKLIFRKNEVVELNDSQQLSIYGGTTSIEVQSHTGTGGTGGNSGPDCPDGPVDRPPTRPFCPPLVTSFE